MRALQTPATSCPPLNSPGISSSHLLRFGHDTSPKPDAHLKRVSSKLGRHRRRRRRPARARCRPATPGWHDPTSHLWVRASDSVRAPLPHLARRPHPPRDRPCRRALCPSILHFIARKASESLKCVTERSPPPLRPLRSGARRLVYLCLSGCQNPVFWLPNPCVG